MRPEGVVSKKIIGAERTDEQSLAYSTRAARRPMHTWREKRGRVQGQVGIRAEEPREAVVRRSVAVVRGGGR